MQEFRRPDGTGNVTYATIVRRRFDPSTTLTWCNRAPSVEGMNLTACTHP